MEDVALVSAFLRSQLKYLDGLSDSDIGNGNVAFQDPGKFKAMVAQQSPGMKKPFSNEEVGAVKARVED